MLTLTSPKTKDGNIRKKSFVFQVQSPVREESSTDELCDRSQINLRHVATIDEFSLHGKKMDSTSFYESPINQVLSEHQPKYIYGVQFKVRTSFYITAPGNDISIGNYVIVDGDRGLDMGFVVSCYSKREFRKIGRYHQKKFQSIHRLAYFSEYQSLMQKCIDEQTAFGLIQSLVFQNFAEMKIKIVNVEYQFDREKLIVYYKSDYERIDFRSIVTAIWFYFRARIWMERYETMDDVLVIGAPILSSASTYFY